ncbi:MAG TPA: hypothetical protein VMF13_19360 [Luteitalea sp.]|nr:hypothetical protein [Luteitalea sp.]
MQADAAVCLRAYARAALGVLAALLTVSDAWAQDVEHAEMAATREAHASRLAVNPPGLSLTIRTRMGRVRFAQGELLTLDLEFRDDSGARHPMEAITYDRSGRLGIDRVIVAPAPGVDDPLHDYYQAMGFGFIGGGISTPPAPLDAPRTLSLDVNEQVRFLRPGTYAVYVESRRFRDGRASATMRREPLMLVSNLLTVEITPHRIDAGPHSTLPSRSLRFADSPQAAVELAHRLLRFEGEMTRVDMEGHEIRFGLFGTPYRTEALRVLREGLATGSRAVNDAVPALAAFLDVMIAMPRDASEDTPMAGDEAARARERMRRYACQLSFWQRQALAAGLRGGPSDVAHAAVAFTDDVPPHCPSPSPVDVAGVLPSVFDQLRPDQQRLMLTSRWGHVAGPAMLPVLRQLVSSPALDQDTRDAALVRLGELAPAEAERVSRDDVTEGRFRFSARAMRLTSADIPAVRQALARQLANARAQSTSLSSLQDGQGPTSRNLLPAVMRLATPRMCATLADWPQREPLSCAARASIVACTLASERNRGRRVLQDQLNDSRSLCRDTLPETLVHAWPQHVPEDTLVEALWHERARVAASAARALAHAGGADARAALWRRLDAWHDRWAGRDSELQVTTPNFEDPVSQARGLERALREALLRGRRWLTTADDRRRVWASCVDAGCREEFSPFLGGPPLRLVVVDAEEWTGQTVYRVDGHAFHTVPDVMERLSLYPKTVTLAWHAGSSHAQGRAAVLYKALVTAASRRGLLILSQPPPVYP